MSERLFREPYRFDFFQAVRMLERLAAPGGGARAAAPRPMAAPGRLLGQDLAPDQEAVRFRSQPSLSFPPSAVIHIRPMAHDLAAGLDAMPITEMVVSFMGVTGPTGVLPYHYTALLLRRIRDKDFSLRDFVDLFHHRAISLFYRAWIKYRLPFAFERAQLEAPGREDFITWTLYCLNGMGTDGLRRRVQAIDEAHLYYSGHFAHFPRSAVVLQELLADYFELPIRVIQLQGQWLQLDAAEQAILPDAEHPDGLNNQLGLNLVVGDRVWDIQSKFRLQVGPLSYAEFQRFVPRSEGLRTLCQLSRAYVGPEFDFDVQLILRPDEVPRFRMGDGTANLGWNTWSRTGKFKKNVDDAVFSMEDV